MNPRIIVIGLVTFLFLGIIGSCLYIGWRVKKEVQGIFSGANTRTSTKPKEAHPALPVHTIEACPAIDDAQYAAYQQADAAARIPLKPGLTLVKVWSSGGEDVESLTQVRSVDKDSVTFTLSAPRVDKGVSQGIMSGERAVCRADLESGSTYMTQAGADTPRVVRSSTAFSMSSSMFSTLKATGTSPVTYLQNVHPAGSDGYAVGIKLEGAFTRLENRPVLFPILVNEERVQLPAIHARGKLGKFSAEVYVLDDRANPLMLEYLVDEGNFLELKLVKISYPAEQKIEKDIKEQGRAEIYGIYFDFNSDVLRAESEPVLKSIAEVLHSNPQWKVSVGGHTDSSGGDAYNLALSGRRAGAVREALAKRYQIAAERLNPIGYGASRPKASNDTIEGRALNRRVELVRE